MEENIQFLRMKSTNFSRVYSNKIDNDDTKVVDIVEINEKYILDINGELRMWLLIYPWCFQ